MPARGTGEAARRIAEAVRASGLSIYDSLDQTPDLYFPTPLLEARLKRELSGLDLDYPPRTRSKVAKEAVAEALGYEPPDRFMRTQPRFPGQNLDVYVQKSDNLQVWNQEVDPLRRYVLLRPNAAGLLTGVRVVTGEVIASFDRTGTLTSKYQARRRPRRSGSSLVTPRDSARLRPLLGTPGRLARILPMSSASDEPRLRTLLPIRDVYRRLRTVIGTQIRDPGTDQDRVRGELVQRAASDALGIGTYKNVGQWPDLLSQALEVKFQMAPTIDLGLVLPTSEAPATHLGQDIRHCDVRYAVFYGAAVDRATVQITEVVVTTGAAFFREFRQFGGLEMNRKLQIPLPHRFFEAK